MSTIMDRVPGAGLGREYEPEKVGGILVLPRSDGSFDLIQHVNPLASYQKPLVVNCEGATITKGSATYNVTVTPNKQAVATAAATPIKITGSSGETALQTPFRTPDKPIRANMFTTPTGNTPNFPLEVTTGTPTRTEMHSSRCLKLTFEGINVKTAAQASVVPNTSSVVAAAAAPTTQTSTLSSATASPVPLQDGYYFYFSPQRDPSRLKDSQTQHKRKHGIDKSKAIAALLSQTLAADSSNEDAKSKEDVKRKEDVKSEEDLEAKNKAEMVETIKGGFAFKIPTKRRKIGGSSKRSTGQVSVMGKTANEALANHINHLESLKNTNEIKELLEKLRALANYAFDWSHLVPHSFANSNAQRAKNMAATPKWINTWMIVFEKIARHFAKLYPKHVSIKPVFKMLGSSELVKTVGYEVNIVKGDIKITINGLVNALELPSKENLPSSTDWVLAVHIFSQLLAEEEASHSTTISVKTTVTGSATTPSPLRVAAAATTRVAAAAAMGAAAAAAAADTPVMTPAAAMAMNTGATTIALKKSGAAAMATEIDSVATAVASKTQVIAPVRRTLFPRTLQSPSQN